jgi:hypothetical protein
MSSTLSRAYHWPRTWSRQIRHRPKKWLVLHESALVLRRTTGKRAPRYVAGRSPAIYHYREQLVIKGKVSNVDGGQGIFVALL